MRATETREVDTLRRAARMSKRDGRLRMVTIRNGRLAITTKRPGFSCLWTNGSEAGQWRSGESAGFRDAAIEAEVIETPKPV